MHVTVAVHPSYVDISYELDGTTYKATGPVAETLYQKLSEKQIDYRVEPESSEKSVGTETTFPLDVTDRAEVSRTLLAQSHECGRRLRAAGLEASRVTVKVRFADFTTITRARSLPAPSQVGTDLAAVARALISAPLNFPAPPTTLDVSAQADYARRPTIDYLCRTGVRYPPPPPINGSLPWLGGETGSTGGER